MFRIRCGAALIAALFFCAGAHGAELAFPSKPVRILVGAAPGGSNDIFARAIGQRISPSLGQPVVVEKGCRLRSPISWRATCRC